MHGLPWRSRCCRCPGKAVRNLAQCVDKQVEDFELCADNFFWFFHNASSVHGTQAVHKALTPYARFL